MKLIEVRDVSKVYRSRKGRIHALAETSFNTHQGEFLAVVGPSGCGKSTLLMLIAGLLTPTAGSIRVGGELVEEPVTDVGVVFQEDLLMEWKHALDNVLVQGKFRGLPMKPLEARARELFRMVGLSDFLDVYPFELSGGMRQRVSICRALVHDPPLLLMDEPFGALDALTRDQMAVDLQRLWKDTDTTVLFITHSITEAIFLSDRVLVFGPQPGQIVDQVEVDLPRPRRLAIRESPEFGELVRRVRDQLSRMGIIRDEDPTADGAGHDPGTLTSEVTADE